MLSTNLILWCHLLLCLQSFQQNISDFNVLKIWFLLYRKFHRGFLNELPLSQTNIFCMCSPQDSMGVLVCCWYILLLLKEENTIIQIGFLNYPNYWNFFCFTHLVARSKISWNFELEYKTELGLIKFYWVWWFYQISQGKRSSLVKISIQWFNITLQTVYWD